MSKEAEFIIMGAGGSTGVPAAGNVWGICDTNEPRNKRLRTSALLKYDDKNIVFDTGPDFRHQANTYNIDRLDAVLYTHDHGDHTNGIDELRIYKNRQKDEIPIYGSDETLSSIKTRHRHMFETRSEYYVRVVERHDLNAADMNKPFNVLNGLEITPFEMKHGDVMSTGYRIGDLAYCVDAAEIPEHSLSVLEGVTTLVIDGGGYKFEVARVHANLEYIYRLQEKIKPKHTVLMALSTFIDYQTVLNETPPHTEPAYDGMKIYIKF